MAKIVIDPLTRIEGHLKIETVIDNGIITDAKSSGSLFRGFEILLKGRDPYDAQHLTQRICGVCPTAHANAAALALEAAFGIADSIPDNGRILRNLIQGANYIMSHIIHFYQLTALDFVDVTKAADYKGKDPALVTIKDFIGRAQSAGDMSLLGPFFPRYEGDYRLPDDINLAAISHYVEALNMRRLAHEMSAIFSGRMPHSVAIVPGGVTSVPAVDKIADFMWKLQDLRNFIDNVYLPDVLAVAGVYSDYFDIGKGCGNFLSFGVFDLERGVADLSVRNRLLKQGSTSISSLTHNVLEPLKITEDVKNSWYSGGSGLYPGQGDTEPDRGKPEGYSWVKAPRYKGGVYEVGPLARMVVSYAAGDSVVRKMVDDTLTHFGVAPSALSSVMGRHAARALETKLLADAMPDWLMALKPGEPVAVEWKTPETGEGMGLWEGPRGVLGHWISIKDSKIENYQCVPPTSWNASPRDESGVPGPIEQALIGTRVRDEDNPFEIVRIVRSFDP
jgi:hydrogenase large subunit